MFAHERHQKLKDILQVHRFRTVEELAVDLNASAATVRRDLVELAERRELQRVHGGAMALHSRGVAGRILNTLPDPQDALPIIEAAAQSVSAGETIALGSGPMILELASLLGAKNHLTVLAGSLAAAWNLCHCAHLKVLCLGGETADPHRLNHGTFASQMLEQMFCDKVFLEVAGVDPDKGLTIEDPSELAVLQTLARQGREVIVLATHSRIGHVAPIRLGGVQTAHRLITHSGAANAGVLQKIQDRGVRVSSV